MAAFLNQVFHPFEELVVVVSAEKVTTEKREVEVRNVSVFNARSEERRAQKAENRGKPNTLLPHPLSLPLFSHLHTCTSTGSRVLGVMIHGATLNTTVSVKMGVSGTRYQHRRHWWFMHLFIFPSESAILV